MDFKVQLWDKMDRRYCLISTNKTKNPEWVHGSDSEQMRDYHYVTRHDYRAILFIMQDIELSSLFQM
jgi:hypothetical protein